MARHEATGTERWVGAVALGFSLLAHFTLLLGYGARAASVEEGEPHPQMMRVRLSAPPAPVTEHTDAHRVPVAAAAGSERLPPAVLTSTRPQPAPVAPLSPPRDELQTPDQSAALPAARARASAGIEPADAEANAHASSADTHARPAVDAGIVSELRQRYLAQVLAAVERHKSYPYAARRRHIQGTVSVHLAIGADGQIDAVRCEGTYAVLCGAAEQAVRRAAPLPPPPAPLALDFAMAFALR